MEIWVLIGLVFNANTDPVGDWKIAAMSAFYTEAKCQEARADFAVNAPKLLPPDKLPGIVVCRKVQLVESW